MATKNCTQCGGAYETNHPTRAKFCGVRCSWDAQRRPKPPKVRKERAPKKKPNSAKAIWRGMLSRCHDSTQRAYEYYGARGISVCERWRASFANFDSDIGPRPDGMTIDRINNDGNYEPGNCRWATRREQAVNRRTTRLYVVNGVEECLAFHARAAGLSPQTVTYRLNHGRSIEAALAHKK